MTGRAASKRPAITGRMVLLGVLGFFGLIFAVNGAFVFFALESWPGLSSRHAYDEGLHYNQTLAAAENQAAMGWQSAVEWRNGELAVTMTGRGGAALGGLSVSVKLIRPAHGGHDFTVALAPQGDGTYGASAEFPLSGLWRAEVTAEDPLGNRFIQIHEMMVRP